MSVNSSIDAKRDFISHLPSELLLSIFDLVSYPVNQVNYPLSKRLLPYYLRNLYHSVDIRNLSQFSLFHRSITQNPSLQPLVNRLSITSIGLTPTASPASFITSFPNLLHLECKHGHFSQDLVTSISPTSRLQHLTLDFGRTSMSSALPRLFLFSSLTSLEIRAETCIFDPISPSPSPSPVERIQSFSLEADFESMWEEGASNMIKLLPNLAQLKLSDLSMEPDYKPLLQALTSFRQQLKSLELWTVTEWDEWAKPCDELLAPFSHLEHLYLGEGTNGYDVAENLRHLHSLRSLHLGPASHIYPRDLVYLVEGPQKLVNLRRIVLDCSRGNMGKHLDVDADVEPTFDHDMGCDDWDLPMPNDWSPEEFGANDLIEAAERNNVTVTGTTIDGLRVVPAWLLEISNREILSVYQYPDQLETTKHRALSGGWASLSRLPQIDWNTLDETRLELVKTDLPEEGWFALSLRNKNAQRYAEELISEEGTGKDISDEESSEEDSSH